MKLIERRSAKLAAFFFGYVCGALALYLILCAARDIRTGMGSEKTLQIIALAAVLAGSALALIIYQVRAAGHRPDRAGIITNVLDLIYFDVLTVLAAFLVFIVFVSGQAGFQDLSPELLPRHAGVAFFLYWVLMMWLLSLARRVKTNMLLRNTLIVSLGYAIWALLRSFGGATMAVIIYLCIMWVNGLFLQNEVLKYNWIYSLVVLSLNAGALYFVISTVVHFDHVRRAAEKIASGDLTAKVDARFMVGPMQRMALTINSIAQGVSLVVADKMKSERFKTELITNVSHDIKAPLTSIINYVDLLKKEEIPGEAARDYIEVLDRKSQRMKTLIQDLMDASKASTGNVAISWERINMNELLKQAVGEYSDRLEQRALSTVLDLPEEALYIRADGRHMWRILENLLSNAQKYALQGSRVYASLSVRDGRVAFELKNVSSEMLNMSADTLMERFVRGDSARSTEGSGLGLTIAQNLAELQGGHFTINIDGDLFKVVITFERA